VDRDVLHDGDGDGAYNTSSSDSCADYFDCNDNNASILPPRDGLYVDNNVTLCNGTYYINVTGLAVVKYNVSNISVTCNGTVIIGNGSGHGVHASSKTDLILDGCAIYRYDKGVELSNAPNSIIRNVIASNNTAFGIHSYNNITYENITVCYNGEYGLRPGSDAILRNVDACYNVDSGLFLQDDRRVNMSNIRAWGNTTHQENGIRIIRAHNSVLVDSNLSYNDYGFKDGSDTENFTIRNVTASNNNNDGFYVGWEGNPYNYSLTDIEAHDNGASGINLRQSDLINITNVNITGGYAPINLYQMTNVQINYAYTTGSSQWGIQVRNSENTTILDSESWSNDYANVRIYDSPQTYIMNVTTWNSTPTVRGYGFYLQDTVNVTLENVSSYDSNAGAYLNGVNTSTINDSIFRDNLVGVNITVGSTGNLIHNNSFYNSSFAHARDDADLSDNQWNTTTNGNATGNFWDDILTVDIYDANLDGYGDNGTE